MSSHILERTVNLQYAAGEDPRTLPYSSVAAARRGLLERLENVARRRFCMAHHHRQRHFQLQYLFTAIQPQVPPPSGHCTRYLRTTSFFPATANIFPGTYKAGASAHSEFKFSRQFTTFSCSSHLAPSVVTFSQSA